MLPRGRLDNDKTLLFFTVTGMSSQQHISLSSVRKSVHRSSIKVEKELDKIKGRILGELSIRQLSKENTGWP